MINHTKLPNSFDLDKLPLEGRVENFDFKNDILKLLADRFQILSIESLEGQFHLIPVEKHYVLTISYKASVTQAGVITGEGVIEGVEEKFDVRLEPSEEPENLPMDEETLMEEEDTEYVPDRMVDVGDIISQYLATALNPFPRKEGAELDKVEGKGLHLLTEEDDRETRNPFSVLKKLKDKG